MAELVTGVRSGATQTGSVQKDVTNVLKKPPIQRSYWRHGVQSEPTYKNLPVLTLGNAHQDHGDRLRRR